MKLNLKDNLKDNLKNTSKYNNGDKLLIKSSLGTLEGIFITSSNNFLTLKLDSGYNISLSLKNIKEIEKISNKISKTKSNKEQKIHKKIEGLKNISILNCGGTLASKVDYSTGGVSAKFTSDELYNLFPEIKEIANINFRLVKQYMSENLRFSHYNEIAKEIKNECDKGVDGIIITHGTDTMHYSAAALSFILENINIPVILVGSQRSSDRGSSDATYNLLSSVIFIANSNFSGVAICMHNDTNDKECSILPGTKTRKLHSSRRDAFRPINSKPYALVNPDKKEIKILSKFPENFQKDLPLNLKLFNDKIKIGLIKMHPNFFAEELLFYKNYDGLVVEGFGLGQIPNVHMDDQTKESDKIIKAVKKLSKDKILVMTSQTIYGRVCMNVYSEGRINLDAGFIGNNLDITTETAFIKLAWLLSNYSKEEAKILFMKNLRDEISERNEQDEFLN